jgi:hypothetical protein
MVGEVRSAFRRRGVELCSIEPPAVPAATLAVWSTVLTASRNGP